MASQSQRIQQLLRAEKRVCSALRRRPRRKRKNRRLKQTEEAAQAKMDRTPAEGEELKAKEDAAPEPRGSCSNEVEKTQEKMTILQTYFWRTG